MMSLFKRHQPQTLAEWLEIATDKLVKPAKTRIQTEIEAHFTEAIAGYVQGGLSEQDAESRALEELGDAKAAAKRFRRSYLTERQKECLRQALKEMRSVFLLLMNFSMFWMLFLDGLAPDYHLSPVGAGFFLGLGFLVLVALPTAALFVSRVGNIKSNYRRLLLLQAVSGLQVGLCISITFSSFNPSRFDVFDRICLCFLTSGVLLRMLFLVRIVKKLGQGTDSSGETFPSDIIPE
jgi:hypothetical protein